MLEQQISSLRSQCPAQAESTSKKPETKASTSNDTRNASVSVEKRSSWGKAEVGVAEEWTKDG